MTALAGTGSRPRDAELVDRPSTRKARWLSRATQALLPAARPAAWIVIAVTIVIAGLGLIGLAWGEAAGEPEVYRQIPYLLSAGLPGLAMVMIGLAVLTIATRTVAAEERAEQMSQLTRTLQELTEVLAAGGKGKS
jgi:hypothetical protein